ncbi:BTAD domain-containing putative transcriptional regulator [Kutzneria sp. CA-103260]|uniref:BTAD domain-containing putative transcriptional regulator n=1 Tax=Kutzneria sp. CA-103260 TaxID=2802641 RepID=UPI001BA8B312|nr:BTAD domain-containing putative transcriptional regulator [Kutzneria sp. CA-103260]QUQ64720.1 Bacterial transcriptional activator domain protein [Kutzneria sp. CA-103260]
MDWVQIRVLGTVEAQVGDELVALGPRQRRLVLGVLAWEVNRPVPIERLIALVWPEEPPRSAAHAVRVAVSDLRSRLQGIDLETHGTGYRLRCDPTAVDVHRFLALVVRARKTTDDQARLELLDEALGLWRGPVLADVASDRTRDLLAAGVEETRLVAIEDRIDVLLRLGYHRDVVEELLGLVDGHPTRERLVGQLMLALYRGGRAGQALDVFRRTRAYLAEELGIDPGGELRRLELAILRDELDQPVAELAAPVLVGRRPELAQLAEWRAKAMSGRPTVVLLEGAAGIGKSTLLDEFSRGVRVLRGQGVAEEGAPAYWPWRQVFRQWLAETEPTVAAEVLGDAADKIARIVPEIRRLAGRSADLPPSTAEERFALFDQVTEFVTRMAAGGLVIVIDDLHWADPASLLLFGHLARGVVGASLLLVGAFRPYEMRQAPRGDDMLVEVTRLAGATRLELRGLSTDEVAQQLSAELGRECEPGEAAAVARRTGGNPLFVREIGRLGRTDPHEVPVGARDAIRQHLSALTPSCRAMLTTASVLSVDIDPVALAAVSGVEIEEALTALDEAVAASVVLPGFRFAHDLVRDGLALDLTPTDRARIHLRAAEHLEARNGQLAQIAHHRLAALPLGDAEVATRIATRAAEQAAAQLAYENAVRLYGEALAANGRPDVDLLIAKADALFLAYDVDAARRTVEEAAELARRNGDPAGLGRATLVRLDHSEPMWLHTVAPWCEQALAELPPEDSVLRARLLALKVSVLVSNDDEDGAKQAGDAALAMAERLGKSEPMIAVLWARQHLSSGPDGNVERLAIGSRMIALAPAAGDWAVLWGHLWRFDALMQLGRVGEAELELDLVEPAVARLDQPIARWHRQRGRAAILEGRGRFAEADAMLVDAARLAERGRNPYGVANMRLARAYVEIETTVGAGVPSVEALERGFGSLIMARIGLANLYVDTGQLDRAREVYRGLPPLAEVPKPAWFRLLVHDQYARIASALGDVDTADAVYRELLPYADLHVTTGSGVLLTNGSVHHCLGITAAVCGRTDDAVHHLRAAIAANVEAGLTPRVAESRYRLSLVLRDRDEAVRQADEARAIAVRLGMAPLAARLL